VNHSKRSEFFAESYKIGFFIVFIFLGKHLTMMKNFRTK